MFPGSLHNHTDFSNLYLIDCINSINCLVDKAVEKGHTVLAFTEHETLAGHVKVEEKQEELNKKGINLKLIRGNEIYLTRNGLEKDTVTDEDRFYHFILLAKDDQGHKQLRELSSIAGCRGFMHKGQMRRPTWYSDLVKVIGDSKGHLIASTACLGSWLDVNLLKYRDTKDESIMASINKWLKCMISIFGRDNFYLELQPSFDEDQVYVNKKL